ncbi:hypothetical protein P4O66_000838 [Electrophorus voltai]|uniref:Uncharacterized protein n=1 Tax=Electrophorus voltai TaxID=2609070 RepID=A0AAD8ZDU1_9TELE|nr:hypothetical protein P4O66_000838 [Electrophorus voltai]
MWVPSCGKQCLPNRTVHLQSTSIESPEVDRDLTIPQEYHDPAKLFSPVKATQLPPAQWEWDCTINLKVGSIPPRSRTYPLSQEETRAMKQYIREAMAQGYICLHFSSISRHILHQKEGLRVEAVRGLPGT